MVWVSPNYSPTQETATLFLYNSIKSVIHSITTVIAKPKFPVGKFLFVSIYKISIVFHVLYIHEQIGTLLSTCILNRITGTKRPYSLITIVKTLKQLCSTWQSHAIQLTLPNISFFLLNTVSFLKSGRTLALFKFCGLGRIFTNVLIFFWYTLRILAMHGQKKQ